MIKSKLKIILWVCLILSLLLMYSGFVFRFNNERSNKAVVPVIDYDEFLRAADKAHIGMEGVLEELKQAGAVTVGIKEVTLEELLYRGEIYISTLGEFFASMQQNSPELIQSIEEHIGASLLNPSSHIVLARDASTVAFLKERLGRRFEDGQYMTFDIGGRTYFYLNTEIEDNFKTGLGFNEENIREIKRMGFEILLLPRKSSGSGTEYLSEYEKVVKEFDVKYIMFDGDVVPGVPDNLSVVKNIMERNNLTLGIIEEPSQIKYVNQKGIDELITGSDYSINRVYIAPESYLQRLDSEEMFYQWVRGVVDRNIRLIYISPLKNKKLTYAENISSTIESVKNFNSFISSKGYAIDNPLTRLSSRFPSSLHYLAASLSLLLAGMLYLLYLSDFRLKKGIVAVLLAFGIVLSIVLNTVLRMDIAKPLALSAAILYPSFSSLLLLRFLKSGRVQSVAGRIFASLGILLGVNAMGMYSIVSLLSDIRYTMNVDIFRGVKMSFIIPLLLFAVNYLFCFIGYGNVKDFLIELMHSKVTYLAAAIFLVGAAGFYIYIGRSGNTMGVSASSLELRIREVFEKLLVARPRLKEFFIGYPALFLMVYLYDRYKKGVIPFIFGLGVIIGGVSMVNSFSHVFTAITVSALRTFYGLIIGAVLGAVLLIVLDLLIKTVIKRFKKPDGYQTSG